jgi:hypothetical protein
MWRSKSTGNVRVLCLSFLLVGCADTKEQAANSPIRESVGAVQGKPFDPLERDKDILAMKRPGHWQVKGHDSSGAQWEGYLVVEHDANAYMTFGFFEWSTEPAGGRYHFKGTYDPETRMVRWTGFTVHDRFGGAVNANYQATLSSDGLKLLNGSWQGGISIPGTWSAEFLHEFARPSQ